MIKRIAVRNFRRLEDVSIDLEAEETVFVGPNNSGKTSATAIFRSFLADRNFSIHDFSVSKIKNVDGFGDAGNGENLPAIELDIWFAIDPDKIEFGRAFSLLPNLTDNFEELGVRLSYKSKDPEKLRDAYLSAYPQGDGGKSAKRLSEFLSQDNNLGRHFETTYASLEKKDDEVVAMGLDQREGKSLLQTLIRVDFVDAQRNINDDEGSRSNRLSNAFASFYRKNLEQVDAAAEAHQVIDENNKKLTEHYEKQFDGLMVMIKGLGVPSINDRQLQIVSSLSPETALRGSTDLLYVDSDRDHKLPELYNGLGFKNLIYMAIQARHFHSQWLRTAQNRPLCQMIFIEEPEVHLHAQVQQTFISNIWKVISQSARIEKENSLYPQLVVTTHSSHVLEATEFGKIRYFRRCLLKGEVTESAKILNATQVHSLRDFKPKPVDMEGQKANEEQALEFLKRYLRLTHCDLFFADAAILVEGSVEKLLLPEMIDKCASRLGQSYLTILEIGGAYAHRFDELMKFLCIPYLIITDLDSVSKAGNHATCRGDEAEALTSNASLKELLHVTTVAELQAMDATKKSTNSPARYISFQTPVLVSEDGVHQSMQARTIEENLAYQNFAMLRSKKIDLGTNMPQGLAEVYETIFRRVKSDQFKKTDFAMSILAGDSTWAVPSYIEEGLTWLETKLYGPAEVRVE